MSQPGKALHNWLLLSAVVALAVAPLLLQRQAKFGGTDDRASEAILRLKPAYKPWFKPVLVPASGEVASLLFAAQAALGAGVVGYSIGIYKGRSQSSRAQGKSSKNSLTQGELETSKNGTQESSHEHSS